MEEYKIWKKNSPFFYDTLYSHALTWPSLTVQWLPNRDKPYGTDHTIQKLLIGTHTSNDEQNYVQIISVKIPEESSKDTRDYRENVLDLNGGPAGSNKPKQARISVDIQINHQGEVNKARYMPQDPKFIATKTVDGAIDLFNYQKHPSKPINDEVKPDLRLLGHTQEGYALEWNPLM